MTDFEDELRDALRRKEPPAGFANRVVRRTRDERTQPRRSPWIQIRDENRGNQRVKRRLQVQRAGKTHRQTRGERAADGELQSCDVLFAWQ